MEIEANSEKKIIIIPATIGHIGDTTPNRQLRVASYSRVSTDQEDQLTSFHAQKAYYNELILKNPKWRLVGNYADEGISGAKAEKRPDFMKLMKHCKKGKIDFIITKSISRFARNTLDTISYVRKLKAMNIGVLFEKENINTLQEASELFLTIMSSLAQEELNSLSQNVKIGIRMRMKSGQVNYQYRHLYGYKKGLDGMPQIIPVQAEIVKRIYQNYLKGHSYQRIADDLVADKVLHLEGKQWNKNLVRGILENEKYVGDVILQKTYIVDPISKKSKKNNGELPKYHIKNNHEAIIERETWRKVQEEFTKRVTKKKVSSNSKTENGKYNGKYALSEVMFCAECGTLYRRTTWIKQNETKDKQDVWRCGNRFDHGTKYCKYSPSVDEISIHEALVEAIFCETSLTGEFSGTLETELRNALRVEDDSEFQIADAEKKVKELTEQTMEMVNLCMKNGTLHQNQDQIKALSDEAKALSDKIEAFKARSQQEPDLDRTMAMLKQEAEYLKTIPREYSDELTRQIIHAVKIVDAETLVVFFKNGTKKIQSMIPRIKSRNAKTEISLQQVAG